jgi:hypothetical protein
VNCLCGQVPRDPLRAQKGGGGMTHEHGWAPLPGTSDTETAVAQAVAAERARCAKVARGMAADRSWGRIWEQACEEIAAAIERGEG